MKVLIATEYSAVYAGNFIPSIVHFYDFCENEGNSVCFAFNNEASSRGWFSEKIGERKSYIFEKKNFARQLDFLKHIIRVEKIDVLYAHFMSYKLLSFLTILFPRLTIINHEHTDMGQQMTCLSKLKEAIKRSLFYKRMTFIFVSEKMQRQFGMYNKRYARFVPNALDTRRFDIDLNNEYRTSGRKEFGILNDEKLILVFGWHYYVKGVDIALKSFEEAFLCNPKLKLAVVYSARVELDKTIKRMREDIGEEAFSRVVLLPPIENIQKYHAMSDVFLSSSRSEAFSYAILEALYVGERVVSSNLEGTNWCLKYKTARIFESENIQSCANALIEASNFRAELFQSDFVDVRAQIESDYDLSDWVKKIYDIMLASYKNKQKHNV